ncbi:MAG: hypothetical protein MSA31_05405 [Bacteroidales bacterium]|nr:hypothetical protein [Bacteroidales bacterium]MDY4926746.1 hypothetical protein [Prevotella sp.]
MQDTITVIIVAIAALFAARHLYRSITAPSCNCSNCKKKKDGGSCCARHEGGCREEEDRQH